MENEPATAAPATDADRTPSAPAGVLRLTRERPPPVGAAPGHRAAAPPPRRGPDAAA